MCLAQFSALYVLQQCVCMCVNYDSNDVTVSSAVKLGRDGVVQTVVAALNKHSSDSALSALCCNAIWALACSGRNLLHLHLLT